MGHELGVVQGGPEGDQAAPVMADDGEPVMAELGHDRHQVLGHAGLGEGLGALAKPFAVPVPGKVGDDDLMPVGQPGG